MQITSTIRFVRLIRDILTFFTIWMSGHFPRLWWQNHFFKPEHDLFRYLTNDGDSVCGPAWNISTTIGYNTMNICSGTLFIPRRGILINLVILWPKLSPEWPKLKNQSKIIPRDPKFPELTDFLHKVSLKQSLKAEQVRLADPTLGSSVISSISAQHLQNWWKSHQLYFVFSVLTSWTNILNVHRVKNYRTKFWVLSRSLKYSVLSCTF